MAKAITYYNHTICTVTVKTESGKLIDVKPKTGVNCLDFNNDLFTHVKYGEIDGKFYKI